MRYHTPNMIHTGRYPILEVYPKEMGRWAQENLSQKRFLVLHNVVPQNWIIVGDSAVADLQKVLTTLDFSVS